MSNRENSNNRENNRENNSGKDETKKSNLVLGVGLVFIFLLSIAWLCLACCLIKNYMVVDKGKEINFLFPVMANIIYLIIFCAVLTLTYKIYTKERKYEAKKEKQETTRQTQ